MAVTDLARIEDRIDRMAAGSTAVSMTIGGVQFESMAQVLEFAKLMAVSGAAIPQHLRGNPGACLAICTRALRFGFDPFTLAEHSYLVNNRGQELIAYDSFVVHAIIEAHAPKIGRMRFEIVGEGDERRCRVSATPEGEHKPLEFLSETLKTLREARGRNDQGKIKGSPLWEQKPEQQLTYNARRDFCRIYFPDVLMGVWDREEFEGSDRARDVTPKPSVAERLKAKAGQRGFSQEHVDAEIGPKQSAKIQQPTSETTASVEEPQQDHAAASTAEYEDRTAEPPSTGAVSEAAKLDAAGGREPGLIGPNPQPAPSALFTEYAQALFRATQVRSLQKLQESFWQQHEWPETDDAACDRLDAILKSHERRVRGEIDAKQCAEEMKELVTGSD